MGGKGRRRNFYNQDISVPGIQGQSLLSPTQSLFNLDKSYNGQDLEDQWVDRLDLTSKHATTASGTTFYSKYQ